MIEVAQRLEELADWLDSGRKSALSYILTLSMLEKVEQWAKDCREAAARLKDLYE